MKTKQQRNKTLRTASVLLVIVMILTVALSGTLAKYTAQATAGSQYARVAAFRVIVNGREIQQWGNDLSFNLFETIICHDWAEAVTWENEETHVVNNSPNQNLADVAVIAPGMGAFAKLEVQNLSEVPVKIAFGAVENEDSIARVTENLDNIELVIVTAEMDDPDLADIFAYAADPVDPTDVTAGSLSDLLDDATVAVDLQPGDKEFLYVAWRWLWNDVPNPGGANDGEYTNDAVDAWDTNLGTAAANWLYQQLAADIGSTDETLVEAGVKNFDSTNEVLGDAADVLNAATATGTHESLDGVAGIWLDAIKIVATQID
jgi:hypothetical protein